MIEDFKLVQGPVDPSSYGYAKGSFEEKYINHFVNGEPLRDMHEFTTSRQHYIDYGRYTNATPNKHPHSPFMKFWNEEKRRCLEGYNIGRDWIPGYAYFYFNYGRIDKVIAIDEKRGKRVFGFPELWDSDYFFYHYIEEAEKRGLHGTVIKRRRWGNSFKAANMCLRNFLLMPGSMSVVYVHDKTFLTTDGIFTKCWKQLGWLNENTAWSKKTQLVNLPHHKRASFRKPLANGAMIESGYMSEIMGISLAGDTKKVRGKASKLILFEEAGAQPILTEAWNVVLESIKQDDSTFGLCLAFGTSGEDENDFSGLIELTNKPDAYDIYAIPDIFSGEIDSKRAFFVPSYINRITDKDGNSDMYTAAMNEAKDREKWKKNLDSTGYAKKIAERPWTISEATLKTEGSPFDILLVRKALGELKVKLVGSDGSENGTFIVGSSGTPQWVMDNSLKYIGSFPNNDDKAEGCWKIWSHPVKNQDNNIDSWRYCAAVDPIDKGSTEAISDNKHSLASTFIIDSITRNIVAEYSGRPQDIEYYYEQLLYGIEYFNAELLYENNLKGLYAYFNSKNKKHLLAFEPQCLKDRAGYVFNGKVKGYHATKETNAWGRQLLSSWSKELVVVSQDESTGEVVKIPRMYCIPSIPLLQEMEAWKLKGNYDRISAMGGLMIFLTDRQLYLTNSTKKDVNDEKVLALSKKIGKMILRPRKMLIDLVNN